MKLPVYELNIDEFDDTTGMFSVSMVDRPAMQVAAVKLAEEEEEVMIVHLKKDKDKDKQYLTSAVIIPNKQIYRNDEELGEHYIVFTENDVEIIRNKFFTISGNLRLSNKNHNQADIVNAQLIESWIIEDSAMDKSTALGFNLPKGTMMATYKILDSDFWVNEVLTGNVTGFSLEGRFNHSPIHLSEKDNCVIIMSELMDMLAGSKD